MLEANTRASDRDIASGARQLTAHAAQAARAARADDKLAVSRQYQLQAKRPIVRPRQISGAALKVPMLLSGLGSVGPEAPNAPPSRLITTDRLHPTSDLAQIYQDGTVGGTDARWRDVELRGYEPGPPIRYLTSRSQPTAHSAGRTRGSKSAATLHRDEVDAGIIEDVSQSYLSGFDDSQMFDEVSKERALAIQSPSMHLSRPVSGAPTPSEKIGRLMRPRTASELGLPRLEHFRPEQRVDAVLLAISTFSKENPAYHVETEFNAVLKSISKDIYAHKLLLRGERPPLIREPGATVLDLEAFIKAFQGVLLRDENDGFLPLEFFDDAESYEMHTPEEWLTLHRRTFVMPDGTELSGAAARSRYVTTQGGRPVLLLEPVIVLAYSEEERQFQVQWLPQGAKMLPRRSGDPWCTQPYCLRNIYYNSADDPFKDTVCYESCHTRTIGVIKTVKRLNLLFDDEDERMWWQRRWAAHMTRRRIEAEAKLGLFMEMYMQRALQFKEMRAELSCYAPAHIPPDFEATPLLEILSDVAGPTSEILDNIFHSWCLDSPFFRHLFLDRLDKTAHAAVIARLESLVPDVTNDLIHANMLASVDYLRRSHRFNKSITDLGICAPFFETRADYFHQLIYERYVGTLSGEFLPGQPVKSIIRYLRRRSRIERRLFCLCVGYSKAYRLLRRECLALHTLNGFLLFNVAGIVPFIAADQVAVIKAGIGGGIQADRDSFRIRLVAQAAPPTSQQEAKRSASNPGAGSPPGTRPPTHRPEPGTDEVQPSQDDEAPAAPPAQTTRRRKRRAEREEADDNPEDMTNVPFYAVPDTMNPRIFELGSLSPGCPLLLDRFVLLSQNHRGRAMAYLRDTLFVDLAAGIVLALNEAGLDVYAPNRLLREYIELERHIYGPEIIVELYGEEYLAAAIEGNAAMPMLEASTAATALAAVPRPTLQQRLPEPLEPLVFGVNSLALTVAQSLGPLSEVTAADIREIDSLRSSIVPIDSRNVSCALSDRIARLRVATQKDEQIGPSRFQNVYGEDTETQSVSSGTSRDSARDTSLSQSKPLVGGLQGSLQQSTLPHDDTILTYEGDSRLEIEPLRSRGRDGYEGNILARGRSRDIADIFAFARLANTMRYDAIMVVVRESIFRYMDMLGLFTSRNRYPLNTVRDHYSGLFRRLLSRTASPDEARAIIKMAGTPIFECVPQTVVTGPLLQLYIDFDAVVRDIVALDKVSSGSVQAFSTFVSTAEGASLTLPISAVCNHVRPPLASIDFERLARRRIHTIDEFAELVKEDSNEAEAPLSRHPQFKVQNNYLENAKQQVKRASYPTVVGLEFSLFPSLDAVEAAVYDNFYHMLRTPAEIPRIEAGIPCFEGDPYYVMKKNLPGPNPVHSPWIAEKRQEIEDYLHDASREPQCVLEVLQSIHRQLFPVDHADYIDPDQYEAFSQRNRGLRQLGYAIKLLPPVDEFYNVVTLESDVNNEEDLVLVEHSTWDYEYVDSEQRRRDAQMAEAQGGSSKSAMNQNAEAEEDDNTEDEDESSEAVEAEGADHGEPLVTLRINSTDLSLRDLRALLLKYTAIREMLRAIPPRIVSGPYEIDCGKAVDALGRRCATLRAQVARVIHFRAIGYANRLIGEWDELRDKMTMDTSTSTEVYAEIRAYVNGIEKTVAAMQRRHQILDRYVAVLEEFAITTADFQKVLSTHEDALVKFALEKSQGQYSKLVDQYKVRYTYLYGSPDRFGDEELAALYWRVRAKPIGVLNSREGAERRLQESFAILARIKDAERADIAEQVNKYKAMTVSFAQRANLSEAPQFADELVGIQNFREKIDAKITVFLKEEAQLGFQPSEFKTYESALEEFQIFEDLWTNVSAFTHNYPMWFNGAFIDMDPKHIMGLVNEWAGNLLRLQKTLMKIGRTARSYTRTKDKDRAACCADSVSITTEIIAKLDEFRAIMPLVEALRNPGLRQHHWKEVSALGKSGVEIQPAASMTLLQLIADGFLEPQTLEKVIMISATATKEFGIERALDKMTADWKNVSLDMKYYGKHEVAQETRSKDGAARVVTYKYYIVKTFDEILLLLDDQFSALQGMRASSAASKFEGRLATMEKKLVYLQDIIDEWTKYQRLWMYLEPIFTSEDIKRQLPEESVLFAESCVFWADQSSDAYRSPSAMALAGRDGVVEKFRANLKSLELVNKHLSSYLENKRRSFARFFFLSDEELLQILAQTRDPEAVQPHVSKCFEGIRRLGFRSNADNAQEIYSMISPEGEEILLENAIIPQGDADIWLGELEKAMKTSLKLLIKRSFSDYVQNVSTFEQLAEIATKALQASMVAPQDQEGKKKRKKGETAKPAEPVEDTPLQQTYAEKIMEPREQWMSRWAAQVIVVLGQVVWTHETTVALKKQEDFYPRALEEYLLKLNYDIDKLVRWIGHIPGSTDEEIPMTRNIRALLVILLTLHVHNRDVTTKIFRSFFGKGTGSVDYSFIWESELKFIYKLIENPRAPTDDSCLYTRQVNAEIPYAYEYLGIGTRLTVTPLTERCYLTLTSAIVSFYGGAPQGPAGTGKTETTKDLAKALAIQCVVFNCSEGLNVASMGRMFKGLAMTGAWSCFDEFNRIDVEVLSVIAQQILTIQRAISARLKRFIFEDAEISLNGNCAVFITMNPGYAGRAELPDNLKALFRPISMTVPDYSLIAEVMLFACGYRDASKLAVKLCMSLKLSSEQLSKQDHYDFGMRALKSILSAASLLKRLYYMEREDKLCLRALNSVNVPKFLQQDVVLFENIVSDLFPECFANKTRNTSRKKSRLTSAREEGQPSASPASLALPTPTPDSVETVDVPITVIDELPAEVPDNLLDGNAYNIGCVDKDIDAEDLLRRFIAAELQRQHLDASQDFIEKTMQLYTTLSVRHGLMNVGRTMSGKTTITDVLAAALGTMRKFLDQYPDFAARFTHEAYPLFYPVLIYRLNAKAITMSELYGNFSEVSNEWSDGIVSSIMRECIKEEPEYRLKWILFDSPVDALWIESMNTVLDDNKKLCLTSGEIITMSANMTIFFEVMDLSQASPATVSRTGMIYCDRLLIPIQSLFLGLIHKHLPTWFLDLEVSITATWPCFKVVENESYMPADGEVALEPEQLLTLNSPADILVAGKSRPNARMRVEGYPDMTMKCVDRLMNLFAWLVAPIVTYMTGAFKPTIYTTPHTVVMTLVKLMASLLACYTAPVGDVLINEADLNDWRKKLPPLSEPGSFIDNILVFALAWSAGAFGDLNTRQHFANIFRHVAYDLPLLFLQSAATGGATLQPPKDESEPETGRRVTYGSGPPFSLANFKIGKQDGDAIAQRAAAIGEGYPHVTPDFMSTDVYLWKMGVPIPYTDDERNADRPDYIGSPYDVFIVTAPARQALKREEAESGAAVTPAVLACELEHSWVHWSESPYYIPTPEVDHSTSFIDTVVPHNNFISSTAILNLLSSSGFPTLLAGPSGSGKSTIVRKLIGLRPDNILLRCCLTANTTSGQLRSVIDPKLEKRRRGIYSFARGKKAIFFVDDAHMPEKEKYGARPPLEVIRQLLEESGWYDIEGGFFKKIINMATIIGCTTSGENIDETLPERLVHHCCTISVPEAADDSFRTIFQTLVRPLFTSVSNPAAGYMEAIVSASISLYRAVCQEFRPTPAHAHYVFSPRDLSRVFQGLMLALKGATPSSPKFSEYYSQELPIVALWAHECTRVFADRLITPQDETRFAELMQTAWQTCPVIGSQPPALSTIIPTALHIPTGYELYFGGAASQAEETPYVQVLMTKPEDLSKVETYYYDHLESYNRSAGAVGKMKLVLFKYAVSHLLRIARILSMDRGHALLIGMPSSGKRSLTRLAAASLSNYYNTMDRVVGPRYVYTRPSSMKIFEPTGKSEFLDSIKGAIRSAGVDASPTLLIVQEALADDYGLECINFLVNLGEIPNLWAADEMNSLYEAILSDLQRERKDGTATEDVSKTYVLEIIADRVMRNMHIVLVTTPESLSLDKLVTSFPSLLGSLSVNWFSPWETDTLRSIARFYLSEHEKSDDIAEILVTVHRDAEKLIEEKYPMLSASPATFLGILNTFQALIEKLSTKLDRGNQRYTNGIARLTETEAAVDTLKAEQTAKQPVLAAAQKEVNAMAKHIELRKAEVGKVKEVVMSEEAIVSKASAEADALAEDCAEELRRAEPLVYRATKALSALKPSDVNEVRSLATPPKLVRFVMDAICIVKGIKISNAPDADNWPVAQKMLRANGFLASLKSYDAERMPEAVAATLQKTYLSSPDFDPVAVQKSSIAAAGLCEWVHAIVAYYTVMKEVNPKREKLALANAEAKRLQDELAIKQKQLKDAEDELAGLEADANKAQQELQRLSAEYELCSNRLVRAEGLIAGLSGEKVRWNAEIDKLQREKEMILPTVLIATAFCSCMGGFDFVDRDSMQQRWGELISRYFPGEALESFKLFEVLAEQAFISRWISNGLPRDAFSLTSACVAMTSRHVPLLVDPQSQARKWAANCLPQDMRTQLETKACVVRIADPSLHKKVEQCLRTGTVLVIEGISNSAFVRSDPKIKAAIIAHNLIFSQAEPRSIEVRFGDSTIEVPSTFALILVSICDIRIPPDSFGDFHYVTFKATKEALEDLLLSVAVECEKPELELQRKSLQAAAAEDATTLLNLETQLLNLLSESQNAEEGQTLLDNVALVDALNETQQRAQDIGRRMVKAAKTSADIDAARVGYRCLARDASCLFFALQRLTKLDAMYENSLQNFLTLFTSVVASGRDIEGDDRLRAIARLFAERLYGSISRGLFVRHKLMFALDICLSMQLTNDELSQAQFDTLLASFSGNLTCEEVPDNLFPSVPDNDWELLVALCHTQQFPELTLEKERVAALTEIMDAVGDKLPLLERYRISTLAYVAFCACVDRKNLVEAVRLHIRTSLGAGFVNTEAASIIEICNESKNTVPVLVLLSSGSDPSNTIMGLADSRGITVHSVSLGRGQGIVAERAIADAATNGGWVLLGNTHLAGSWLQKLESLCDAIADNSYDPNAGSGAARGMDKGQKRQAFEIHNDFRLFLTTMPFPQFPSSIARNSTKISTEPPLGLKNNMLRLLGAYEVADLTLVPDLMKRAEQQGVKSFETLRTTDPLRIAYQTDKRYKTLLWHLSLFFSVVLERRRFGSIGFNSPYDWSDPDLHISKSQLAVRFQELASLDSSLLSGKLVAAMAALKFLTAEINVGGRVSDSKDRLCVISLMNAFYDDDLKQLGRDVHEIYGLPSGLSFTKESLLEHVATNWPDTDLPEVYGLDSNATIFLAQSSGKELMTLVLDAYRGSGDNKKGSTNSSDAILVQINRILSELPPLFDEKAIGEKYPTNYFQSMNTVLVQECGRYNKLLRIIRTTLNNVENCIKGLIIMTKETESIINALEFNQVPTVWETAAWPSIMPLATWIVDLHRRIAFIRDWVENGTPAVVWFSGFSYPQAFLTGTLQNYSRATKIAIDELAFDFSTESPKEGHAATISGLFLQCASWAAAHGLVAARPGVLFEEMPNITLIPMRAVDFEVGSRYPCPVYRTSLRRGVLTTTGHSSNYIFDVLLPSEEPAGKWVRLGVALFQQNA
ncbi:Dynein heavy chain [Giardia muris]|uniref:Dynein heavy chain, cytoplasmic n=1 Tax=Giardia muris TaxID=5742 RepID=A0A4Z1SZA7_GIAMU|nr:Dynein heavy chain [Giardia muris]|eukprot:TNJ26993.1 Dynein heavy chain [Giardia muris]